MTKVMKSFTAADKVSEARVELQPLSSVNFTTDIDAFNRG